MTSKEFFWNTFLIILELRKHLQNLYPQLLLWVLHCYSCSTWSIFPLRSLYTYSSSHILNFFSHSCETEYGLGIFLVHCYLFVTIVHLPSLNLAHLWSCCSTNHFSCYEPSGHCSLRPVALSLVQSVRNILVSLIFLEHTKYSLVSGPYMLFPLVGVTQDTCMNILHLFTSQKLLLQSHLKKASSEYLMTNKKSPPWLWQSLSSMNILHSTYYHLMCIKLFICSLLVSSH